MNSWANQCKSLVVVSGSILLITIGAVKVYIHLKKKSKRAKYPKDTVILHQFPPNKSCPSLSPFCLKLETWLRMTNIKYQNEYVLISRSAKGKAPWITYNNEDISDSQFCIEYLSKITGKDLSDSLNSIEKSLSRAFLKMCEESLRWCLIMQRFKYGKASDLEMPYLFFKIISKKAVKDCVAQGYGRHSKEEVYGIGKADLKSLEDFLGNKQFFFGDKPDVLDAVVFSFICQFVYFDKGDFNEFLTKNCTNLIRHFETIKETFWPDWQSRIAN